MTADVIPLETTDLDTSSGLDWRHCACKCSTGKLALCGADLTGRTPLGFRPPEEHCCPLCVVLYEATPNCPKCGRRWSNKNTL